MPRRRSPETMERDQRAYDLFRRGLSYRQIAAEIGYASSDSAFEAVRRAAKESASDALKDIEAKQAFLDRFQDYRRAAQRVLSTRHFVTTQAGKLVTGPDGQPIIDDDPVLRALDRLLKIDDTELRLRDLYPATKSRVEVITEETIDAECAKLIREIEQREAAAAPADPSAA